MTSEHTHAEKDIWVIFCSYSDGYIELNLTKEQERPNKGWEVFLFINLARYVLC